MDKKKKQDKENKIEGIKKELEKCRKERGEYLAGWQRAQADFINYKKSEIERLERAGESAENEIILDILKIFDMFELAKKQIPKENRDSKWVEGIFAISGQFKKFLKDKGIEEINPVGEDFNPQFHEAVEQVGSRGESGKVIEVVEKGYMKTGGRLLRPAKVKVSQ